MAHIAAGFVTVYYNGEKHRKRLLKVHVGIQFLKYFTHNILWVKCAMG